MTPPLACSVRDCGLLLELHGRTYSCARRHSYDLARSGYINLLQPQDRRSRAAGDSAEAIAARARLLSQGVGGALLAAVTQIALALLADGGVIVDLGSGSGELLAGVVERRPALTAIGIDLSTAASEHAARRYPGVVWVVANADRRLPLLDGTVDAVLSVHGRRNAPECARVLARGSHLVVAVPAADDLIELRSHVQGEAVMRERGDAVEREHEADFTLVSRADVREQHWLERPALQDLLRGTYRGARKSLGTRMDTLDRLEVTLASSVFVFQRR